MITNKGPSKVIQMLHADAGVCPEPTNEYVQYAMLALSTHRNDIERVRLILESSAELDKHSGTFGSVTHTAATDGHFEIFQSLHQYGADINRPAGGWRGNCLQTAALGGHAEVVCFLLSGDLGLDVQRSDYKPRLKEYLYRMPGKGDIDNDFVGAILCAIHSGNNIVVEDLLKEVDGRRLRLAARMSQRILTTAMETCH